MIYILPPFLPTLAIKKTDEILLVKGADGWGSLFLFWLVIRCCALAGISAIEVY